MKIRYADFYELLEMPNGMYARSEGAETVSTVRVVHPDDWVHLVGEKERQFLAFKAVRSQFPNCLAEDMDTDLVEWAEDGHEEEADAVFLAMDIWISANFEPVDEWVPDNTGTVKWPDMPFRPLVRRFT